MRRAALGLLLLAGTSSFGALACGGGGTPPSGTPSAEVPAPASSNAGVGGGGGTRAVDAGTAPAKRQKFVVAIEVDQLSAWVAAARFPELPKDGGFARLIREGTWVKNLRYPYAVTDTAPGHASLHTGKVPAESGIFGNEVPDASGKRISIMRDETTRAVTPDGEKNAPGASASRLLVDTLADRLRAASPDALVLSVSLKDRGAIVPGGKHPSHVIWFDAGQGSFVTSTAFEKSFPAWAKEIGSAAAVAKARSTPWTLTDPDWVKAHAASPDDAPGEGNLEGLGTTFPHVAKSSPGYRTLPASDEAIMQIALAGLAAEYDPQKPTLLLLSLSASDIVGHTFGPDSWEAWDHLMKLDAKLGAFFAELDRRVGDYDVLLSADHGNVSMPEAEAARAKLPACANAKAAAKSTDPYERPCRKGVRLGPNEMRDELQAATKKALGGGDWVMGLADPYVFLTPAARALVADKRALLDKTIRATIANDQKGEVAEIFDVRMLAERCPQVLAQARGIPARALPGEDTLTLVCRSWPPKAEAGDYYLVPKSGSFFDAEVVVGKGSSHGTPYLHDRTVPLLVRAKDRIDAGVVVDDPVDFSVFSALGASFLGLEATSPRDALAARRASPADAPKSDGKR